MNTSCQIVTLRHGKGLNEFGNHGIWLCTLGLLQFSLCAETDCSFSSREGNLLVLVWIGSKWKFLAHGSIPLNHSVAFPPFPFPFVLSLSLTMSREFINSGS